MRQFLGANRPDPDVGGIARAHGRAGFEKNGALNPSRGGNAKGTRAIAGADIQQLAAMTGNICNNELFDASEIGAALLRDE